jgi:lysophospholipase L1-like esterase
MTKSFVAMFLFTVCLATALASLTSCTKDEEVNTNLTMTLPASTPRSDSNFTYLALGDSYTIGQGVSESERYPHLTVASLKQYGIQLQTPRYIAQTGWSTSNLQFAISQAEFLRSFDIVTLLIGVNDQYQGKDTSEYRARFTELLKTAIQLAGNRTEGVFILSIPDYSATPFVQQDYKERVRLGIDQFNAINKEITLAMGVTYIDITPLTRMAATDESLLADDLLHYSRKENQQWADLLASSIKGVLK